MFVDYDDSDWEEAEPQKLSFGSVGDSRAVYVWLAETNASIIYCRHKYFNYRREFVTSHIFIKNVTSVHWGHD